MKERRKLMGNLYQRKVTVQSPTEKQNKQTESFEGLEALDSKITPIYAVEFLPKYLCAISLR